MADKRRKSTTPGSDPPTPDAIELPERWSVQRKTELVLRVLRGEPLDAVSRESQVPANELETWKRVFLEHGTRELKSRSDPEERELTLARAKIGELMMRLSSWQSTSRKKGGSRTSGRSTSDEDGDQPEQRTALSADDGLCGLPRAAFDGVPGDRAGARRPRRHGKARTEDLGERY